MAYTQYISTGTPNTQFSVDWEAKGIPLIAYKECLTLLNKLTTVMMGTVRDDPVTLTHDFAAAVYIFFNTVEVPFVEYLENEKKVKRIIWENKKIEAKDYDTIVAYCASIDSATYKYRAQKCIALFKLCKNWCFKEGPFRTRDEYHGPEEAFQYG